MNIFASSAKLCGPSPAFPTSVLKLPAAHVWLTSAQNFVAKKKLLLCDFTVRLPRQESDNVSCRFGADYSRCSWKHFKRPAVCDTEKIYDTRQRPPSFLLASQMKVCRQNIKEFLFYSCRLMSCLFPLKAPNVKMSVITDIQRSVIERALLSLFTLCCSSGLVVLADSMRSAEGGLQLRLSGSASKTQAHVEAGSRT